MNTSNDPPKNPETVLIIGAYGLIGTGIAQRLTADGHNVTGLGRNHETAKRVLPNIPWIIRDITNLCHADDWLPHLRDFTTVVNCSGALQDGPSDNLEAIHTHAVAALAAACAASNVNLIQISAIGANENASTAFLSTKARGDAAIRSSGARYHILRPGLVFAPHAYGGSTMLRMLAAAPILQPLALPNALIQTISLDDLATVVSAAIAGKIPNGFEADLLEPTPHTLRDTVASVRHWLGFAPARRTVILPVFATTALSKIADALAHFGWRSPLRSTAIQVLSEGVKGTPTDLTPFGLTPISSFSQTLAALPARAEDRLFARMALLTPLMVITMALFWLTSGIIGLAQANTAALTLANTGWPHGLAVLSVVFWAFIDIAIAAAFAIRKYAPAACWAAIAVSLFYLASSTLFVPALWLDPLGPLVKIFPAIALALVTRAALETR